MFVILLRFSMNRSRAGELMEGHKEWIRRGFADGVFLLAGSLAPDSGGAIVAHNTSADELRARVNLDPFVTANVVTPELIEIEPSRTDKRFEFLLAKS
jgi:uncharacterized protein YciI